MYLEFKRSQGAHVCNKDTLHKYANTLVSDICNDTAFQIYMHVQLAYSYAEMHSVLAQQQIGDCWAVALGALTVAAH